MLFDTLVVALCALPIAAFLTGMMRKFALSRGLLDTPNDRSSHTVPTPRGGGISIVIAVNTALVVMALIGTVQPKLFSALVGGGMAVALIGFMDDRRALPAWVRLTVHVTAAVWAVTWLGGLPRLGAGGALLELGWIGPVFAVLGIVWALNLFNFMDGIDGIAASEAAFIAIGGAFLALVLGHGGAIASIGLVFGAACLGFLVWNWPPAKIFMGDVGSGYLGYVIAVLALAATREDSNALWTWLVLAGVFFVDATITLVRRIARGDRVFEAHRSHAYQWLGRRWGSHRRVTVAVLFVNLLWLFPCASIAMLHPVWAPRIAAIGMAPLVLVAIMAGAGRSEPV
jgi:Fuc2NAc and GlcNAc transferase